MQKNELLRSFQSKTISRLPCPKCGLKSLKAILESFQQYEAIEVDRDDPDFDALESDESVELVFTLIAECSIQSCRSRTSCIGKGVPFWDSPDQDPGTRFVNYKLQPKYFYPSLRFITEPKGTPLIVTQALEDSFSNFFSSPSTSLSQLRVALEKLVGLIAVQDSSKHLHNKINELPSPYEKVIKPMLAVKWLGNAGAHGDQVKEFDVLQAYEIFSMVLTQLSHGNSIQKKIDAINEKKGPIS